MLTTVLLPTLALCGVSASSAILITAFPGRRVGQMLIAITGFAVCALVFWRSLDISDAILAAMLIYGNGAGLFVGYWVNKQENARLRALYSVCGTILGCLPCLFFLWITLPFRMWDETQDQSRSPDGVYTATLYYKDGLTFGFQHVSLEARGWHLFGGHTEVTEMACEGLQKVSWKGNRTLVVDYDGTKHKDTLMDTDFVRRDQRWRDVQIIYRKVNTSDGGSSSAVP